MSRVLRLHLRLPRRPVVQVQQTLQLYVRVSELQEEVRDARNGTAVVDRSIVSRTVRRLSRERGAARQLEEENKVGAPHRGDPVKFSPDQPCWNPAGGCSCSCGCGGMGNERVSE